MHIASADKKCSVLKWLNVPFCLSCQTKMHSNRLSEENIAAMWLVIFLTAIFQFTFYYAIYIIIVVEYSFCVGIKSQEEFCTELG